MDFFPLQYLFHSILFSCFRKISPALGRQFRPYQRFKQFHEVDELFTSFNLKNILYFRNHNEITRLYILPEDIIMQ